MISAESKQVSNKSFIENILKSSVAGLKVIAFLGRKRISQFVIENSNPEAAKHFSEWKELTSITFRNNCRWKFNFYLKIKTFPTFLIAKLHSTTLDDLKSTRNSFWRSNNFCNKLNCHLLWVERFFQASEWVLN